MQWRITVEAVDNTGDEFRKEFLVEKSLDDLTEGAWAVPSKTARR